MTTRPTMIVQSVDRTDPYIGTSHVFDVVAWRPARTLDWNRLTDPPIDFMTALEAPEPEPGDSDYWAVTLPAPDLVLTATMRTIPLFGRQVVWGLWHAPLGEVRPDWDPMVGQDRQRPQFVVGGATGRYGYDTRAAAQKAAIEYVAIALASMLGHTPEELDALVG